MTTTVQIERVLGPELFFDVPFFVSRQRRWEVKDSRLSVRPRIRFWWFFAQSCILMMLKKCFKRIFEKKILVCPPRGVLTQKTFWVKMDFWVYIIETAHQILTIFCQMLDTIALNDLALVRCTKNLVPFLRFTAAERPQHCAIVLFSPGLAVRIANFLK